MRLRVTEHEFILQHPFLTCCENSEYNRTVLPSCEALPCFLLVLEQSEQMSWPLIPIACALLLSMWEDSHCPSEFQLSPLRGLGLLSRYKHRGFASLWKVPEVPWCDPLLQDMPAWASFRFILIKPNKIVCTGEPGTYNTAPRKKCWNICKNA